MFIKSIEGIKNYSTFENIRNYSDKQDLQFLKNNIIYAENGVGKTSFSLIFQSLASENVSLLNKKKRLQSSDDIFISLKFDDPINMVIFKEKTNKWNKNINFIDVFNSFYFKNNVYTFNDINDYYAKRIQGNLKIDNLIQDYHSSQSKIDRARSKRNTASKKYKHASLFESNNNVQLNRLKNTYNQLSKNYEDQKQVSHQIGQNLLDEYNKIGSDYITLVNKYLNRFTDKIKTIPGHTVLGGINELSKKIPFFSKYVFSLEIDGIKTEFTNRRDTSFDYFLSDGDKSSIALASFLARLDTVTNLDQYLIVIDDPFTSFDSQRKNQTILLIDELSQKVNQTIVLSHDLNFSLNLERKFQRTNPTKSLNMYRTHGNSALKSINLSEEGEDKYIYAVHNLHNILENGIENRSQFEYIKSTIRIALEGIFKIKFYEFELDHKKRWLGDYLGYIRESENDAQYTKFKRLVEYLPELDAINEYSSPSHHINPSSGYSEVPNTGELNMYVKNTLDMIDKI